LTTSRRKTHRESFSAGTAATEKRRRDPPAADYHDQVTDDHLRALEACVQDEFKGETFELVSGPAW
jgi:hypothetical protein